MTQDLHHRTARVMAAFGKTGEVQREQVERLLGILPPKHKHEDAGRPYAPPAALAEGQAHD